jgi:hypothetical protein
VASFQAQHGGIIIGHAVLAADYVPSHFSRSQSRITVTLRERIGDEPLWACCSRSGLLEH